VLRYVLVSFGEKVGIGNTLTEALNDVLGLAPDAGGTDTGGDTTGSGGTTTGGGAVSSDVRQLLQQAETKFATAQKALQSGDLEGYAKAQAEARDLVQQAIAAANKATPTPSPSATPSPSGSSSPSPSASPSG
jgi:uncharacterized membrane protein (UPF0182 family)